MQVPKLSVGRDFVTLTIPRDKLDKGFQGYITTPKGERVRDLRLDGLSIFGRWAGASNTWFEVARFSSSGLDESMPIGDRIYLARNYDFVDSNERSKLGLSYEEVRARAWHQPDVVERAGLLPAPDFTH